VLPPKVSKAAGLIKRMALVRCRRIRKKRRPNPPPQFDQQEPPQEAGSTGLQHSVEKEAGLNHTAKPP